MSRQDSLGDRLVGQNGSANTRTRSREMMMEAIERERRSMRWIRITCLLSWGLVLIVPLLTSFLFVARTGPVMMGRPGFLRDGLFILQPLASGIGTIAFVVAIISTAALFLRSRSVTLASIEARLQHLEELLERRDRHGG